MVNLIIDLIINLSILIVIGLVIGLAIGLIIYFIAAIFKSSFTKKNRALKWGMIISLFYVLIMSELWNTIHIADWIIGLVTLGFLILPSLIAHSYDKKYNYNKPYKNINEDNVKKEENNNVKGIISNIKNSNKFSKRNKIIFAIIGIFVIVSFGIGINRINQEKYNDSMISTSKKIVNLGADSEKIANNYISLWSGKINDNYTTEWTREYIARYIGINPKDFIRNTKPMELNYAIDFDEVLQCYNQYNNNTGINNELNKRLSEIENDIKNLNSPPNKFKKSYNELTQMYVNLNTLVKLATNPNGSLISYRNDKNILDNNIMNEYNLFKTQLPN